MAENAPLFITAKDADKYLDRKELLQRLEKALGNFSKGKDGGVDQPVRSFVRVQAHKGLLGVMPGYSQHDGALATKLVSVYPENQHMPTHKAYIMLFKPEDGSLLALMDGDIVTEVRTAAASAIATKYLANPASKILAIVGSGVQARSHYEILKMLHNFDEVRVWSRKFENAQKLAGEIGARACQTVEDAVKDADIICTVTFTTTPVLQASWVKPGAHINSVGACICTMQELATDLMQSAVVYCDSREASAKESGNVILSKTTPYAEIGEVINGEKEAKLKETTVFDSLGLAIEDCVAAKLVYDNYCKEHK